MKCNQGALLSGCQVKATTEKNASEDKKAQCYSYPHISTLSLALESSLIFMTNIKCWVCTLQLAQSYKLREHIQCFRNALDHKIIDWLLRFDSGWQAIIPKSDRTPTRVPSPLVLGLASGRHCTLKHFRINSQESQAIKDLTAHLPGPLIFINKDFDTQKREMNSLSKAEFKLETRFSNVVLQGQGGM